MDVDLMLSDACKTAEKTIVRLYGSDAPKGVSGVLTALARLCYSIGKGVGYGEGHVDAKNGRDQRVVAKAN